MFSRVLGQEYMLCHAPCHHWAPILLFLMLSALCIKTSVVRFVCADSQYDLTAVFEDQLYGLACIRLASLIN